jgi:hypothetical protein
MNNDPDICELTLILATLAAVCFVALVLLDPSFSFLVLDEFP